MTLRSSCAFGAMTTSTTPGEKFAPGSDHRVRSDQLDKLLSDIFITRANRALFITFQGGTYEDLIHVIDAFLDVPPRLSPTLPLFCTELDRFGDKLESARVFLLTERSERDMVEHYGRCRVGPMVTELHSFPCWPRPAHQEPLRRPHSGWTEPVVLKTRHLLETGIKNINPGLLRVTIPQPTLACQYAILPRYGVRVN